MSHMLVLTYVIPCFCVSASFSLLIRASGVREKSSTLGSCTAFSASGACVEVEGMKVNFQGRGRVSGSGQTFL